MTNLSQRIKRRAFLAGSAALAPAGFAATGAIAAQDYQTDDTSILCLFRQWQDEHRLVNDTSRSQEHLYASMARLDQLEDAILAEPCTSATDFAAKLIAYTNDGGFDLDSNERGGLIWKEARELLGASVNQSAFFDA